MNKKLTRSELLSALASRVGDDGSGDLGVIIDHATDGDTLDDLVQVVLDARADAKAEHEDPPDSERTLRADYEYDLAKNDELTGDDQ